MRSSAVALAGEARQADGSGFTPQQFDALTAALESLAAGPFTAMDALVAVVPTGITRNAGDVATILDDLVDLGYLRRLPDAGGPRRYALAT